MKKLLIKLALGVSLFAAALTNAAYAVDNIRVNAVSPGMTQTDIHERSTQDLGRLERLKPFIPMQRIGEPREIAEAVLFRRLATLETDVPVGTGSGDFLIYLQHLHLLQTLVQAF